MSKGRYDETFAGEDALRRVRKGLYESNFFMKTIFYLQSRTEDHFTYRVDPDEMSLFVAFLSGSSLLAKVHLFKEPSVYKGLILLN